METTEIANAHLSRAGNTTKHMTAAHRIDSLTDLALHYNRDKHAKMPSLLVRKMTDAKKRIPDLENKLQELLVQHEVSPSQIPVLVSELRTLASFLASRDISSLGDGLESAIELVSDSIRTNKCSIARLAASAKMRNKLRSRLTRDNAKLRKLLHEYKVQTGSEISPADVSEGCFPWHSVGLESDGLSLSARRAICDVHMRLSRLREEVDIVRKEAGQFLMNAGQVLTLLQENEAVSISSCLDASSSFSHHRKYISQIFYNNF